MPDTVIKPSTLPEGLLVKTAGDRFKVLRGGQLVDVLGDAMSEAPSPIVSPGKPIADKSTAAYFYSAEDEAEIKQQSDQMGDVSAAPAYDAVGVAAKLKTKFSLTFTDDLLKNRFRRIVELRLRDVRDDLETTDMLSRSTKVGGMSLPSGQAERIVDALQPEVERIHQLKPAVSGQPSEVSRQKSGVTPSASPPPKTFFPPVPKPFFKTPASSSLPKVSQPIKPMPPPAKTEAPARLQSFPPPTLPVEPLATRPRVVPPPSTPPKMQRPTIRPDKPVMEDIRRPSRLVGPVDELREMTLDDFRRLGNTPSESVKKIRGKIQTLGEDSFARGIEGINAWRGSSLHQAYLEVGRASMETGRTIAEVIRQRLAPDPNGMTQEEFLAVLHLNEQLRF